MANAVLILPLHRPITRATFPLATVLLMLANVLVFFGGQAGDGPALEQVQRYYVQSGLGGYEAPAYQRYLRRSGQHRALAELQAVPQDERVDFVGGRTLTDVAFVTALHEGGLFEDAGRFAAWQPLRARYETLQQDVFTLRHVLRSSEVDPWRMLSAAFLHGGFGHLLGNMVFLLAIGLLVEGALGSWRFLGVYLAGAFGASAASLLWRWGEAGGGLGASGAIAALMGAFCLVWGRQPVRFFYWIGVVFDYVRAPAIWLFPLWLGWELYQLLFSDELGVGFDAHAGGLVTGALAGAMLVALGQVRTGFIREARDAVDDFEPRLLQAQQHLGRLQLDQAETLLAELLREQPEHAGALQAYYRAARLSGGRKLQHQRATGLLARPAKDAQQVALQREAWLDLHADGAAGAPGPAQAAALLRRWLELGEVEAVEAVLDGIGGTPDATDTGAADAYGGQAQLWFELALAYRDRLADEAHLRALRKLLARHPGQPQAAKARFLLENG